jgi:hypothetical protein
MARMSGSVGFSPIDLYQQYAAKESTYASNALKANPQDQSLVAYFNAHAASVTTPEQLLKNYKLLTVVLTAFNLQGSINDTALLKQLMTQNPSSSTSLAQKLQNSSYLLFAKALSNWSTPPFANASDRAQLIQSYTTNTFEQSADQQTPGIADALYFTREMPNIKSIAALQSDANLLKVAVATTGITYDQYVELNFNQQTDLLTKALKPSQFQNAKYVKQIAEQYLIQQSSNGASSPPPPGSVASLFSDDSSNAGDGVLNILDPGANLDTSDDSGGSNTLSLFA